MARAGKKDERQSMRDKMKDRAANRESSGRGGVKFTFPEKQEIKFIKIEKAGTRRFDFIPYEITVKNHPAGVEPGDLWYQRTIWTHNGVGPEEKSYLCLKTVGKKCPICDYRAQLVKQADADEDLIKSLNAKERELFQVIDLDTKGDDIWLWEYSYHLFGKKLEEEIRQGTEDGDDYKAGFADLEGGSTLKIRFAQKKMGKNEFYETTRIDFEDREDYGEEILDDVLNLDEILNVLPYDKLEGIFLQTEAEDDPPPKKGRGRGSKDEEEPPARGRDRAAKEEPADEEEPPARGRGRGAKEEPPARGRGRDAKEEPADEEPPARGRRGAAKEEEPPARGRGRGAAKEEEPPARGRGRAAKEEPEEKPARGGRGKAKEKEPELAEDECPASDDGYGVEEGEHDECFECPNWDTCKELSDEAKETAKKPAGRRGR